jgi:hypothetical protein
VVKVVGIIQPVETRELSAEGESYVDAKAAIEAQVPEGWRLLQVTVQ